MPLLFNARAENNFATGVIDYGIIVQDIDEAVAFYESIGFIQLTAFTLPARLAGDSGLTDYKEVAVVMMTLTGGESDTKVKLMELLGSHNTTCKKI